MVLLISIKTLKDKYTIDDNIEDRYLIGNIVKGQDFIIKPLIGRERYNTLINGIDTNTLTVEDKELLEGVEPILAYYVMSELVYSTAYKLKNKGLEDGSDSGRFDELVRISRKYLIDSQHYEQILRGSISTGSCSESKGVYKTGLYLH